MNANIFEFKNNEILMQFNPLFLPANNFVDNSGNLKTFKLSNSSYLFSDIIKVFVGTDLTNNTLETGLTLSQNNISKQQISAENIFSFNIGNNNNPENSSEALQNNDTSLNGLKAIIELINKLSVLGQINLSQTGDSNKSVDSTNEKLLTSTGLKTLLVNIINSINSNNLPGSNKVNESTDKDEKSKGKNENNDQINNLISQILSSLKANNPVIINIISNQENLKLEIGKVDIQGFSNGFNDLDSIIKEGISKNKYGESLSKGFAEQNSELTVIDSNPNSSEFKDAVTKLKQSEINTPDNEKDILSVSENKNGLKTLVQDFELSSNDSNVNLSGEIKETISKNGEGIVSSENKNTSGTILNTDNSGNQKTVDYLKSLKQDKNLDKPDLFSIKLEVTGRAKSSSEVKSDIKTNMLKGSINQSTNSNTKNFQDSLSIEELIASKSNLKGITKVSNSEQKQSIQQNKELSITESDLKGINKKLSNGNDISIKIENNKAANKFSEQKLESSTSKNVQNISDQVNEQKFTSENPDNKNLENTIKAEFQIPVKDNEKISNNQQDSKTNSTGNIKTDNPGKINANEAPLEDIYNENLEDNKQNTQGNSKDQSQFSQGKGENVFLSYMNKIDMNNMQNIRKPVYFDNISEQMKKIDASEIVKEISKLASSEDQKNVVLKLMPESLGKVKISLDINKNIIHAHAEVENEAARSLMQNNIDNLKQSLVQQGMQLNSLNISLSNQKGQKSNKSFLSKRKPVYSEQIKEIDEKENINISKHYGYNTYEFLA